VQPRQVLFGGTLAVLFIAAVWGAFSYGIHIGRPRPLDLNYPENWVVILDTNAVLDREGSPVQVQVGVMSRIEGEEALHNLRQNRITISDKQGVHTFMWPGGGYAAGKCQLLDIDQDGVQEFLFSTFEGDDTYLRVVRFQGGKFQFRIRNDELRVATVSPEPVHIEGEQGWSFIQKYAYPEGASTAYVDVPRVMQWTASAGFQDVSAAFPEYFRAQVLPELRSRMSHEPNSLKKQFFADAISSIERRVDVGPSLGQ
jgi:hypothetical protein